MATRITDQTNEDNKIPHKNWWTLTDWVLPSFPTFSVTLLQNADTHQSYELEQVTSMDVCSTVGRKVQLAGHTSDFPKIKLMIQFGRCYGWKRTCASQPRKWDIWYWKTWVKGYPECLLFDDVIWSIHSMEGLTLTFDIWFLPSAHLILHGHCMPYM